MDFGSGEHAEETAAVHWLPGGLGGSPMPLTFDPARLTLARERAGWTRRHLATRLRLTTAQLRAYEQGTVRPDAAALLRFSTELGLPPRYFEKRAEVLAVSEQAAHFRRAGTVRRFERRQAAAMVSHLADLVRLIQDRVRLTPVDVPRLGGHAWTPERRPAMAARLVREQWGLGDDPFYHLLRHMEAHGIVVGLAGFGAADRLGAFGCEPPGLDRPVICLPRHGDDPLRRRFDAAHELGHLVLHEDPRPGDPQHEREADRFAIELLMPEAIRESLPWRRDFWTAYGVQKTWGVSLLNIHRRAVELGVMKQREFEACVRIWRRAKMRDIEPAGGEYSAEWPLMLAQAIEIGDGLSPESAAAGLGLPYGELLDLIGLQQDEQPGLRLVSA